MKKIYASFLIPVIILISCSEDSTTSITGSIKNIETGESIENAFIIQDDEFLATTNSNGEFNIVPIDPGTYELVFSALEFNDKVSITVAEKGESTEIDMYLQPDAKTGSIVGELQDKSNFDENLTADPEMNKWSKQEIIDGITGATIMSRTLPEDAVYALYIGDSLLLNFDDYGQYWSEIQTGTYPLTAKCTGYNPSTKIVRIEADSLVFINFFLSKSE